MMKRILITGASSGIGEGTALYFAEQGWQVIATMRNPQQSKLEHKNIRTLALDVTDTTSIQSAVAFVQAEYGGLDVLLNNAGYGAAGPLEAATDDQIKRQFDVNLFGVISTTRAFLPMFRAQKSGLFINISSIGGLITLPMFSLYHATKWALEGLSESLRYELNGLGIQVKIVEPGGVNTDFAGRSLDMFDISNFEDYQPFVERMIANFTPERQAGYSSAEDMAKVIFKAATDNTDQLRYVAGPDAQAMWERRQAVPTETFMKEIQQNMLG